MKKILLLPLLFGLVSPAIAHNEFNGGCGNHCVVKSSWKSIPEVKKSNPEVNSNLTNKQIKILNEENRQTSSIDNQVDDSEINLKRTAEPKNSMAIYILIAILVTVIPFITWRYFTK